MGDGLRGEIHSQTIPECLFKLHVNAETGRLVLSRAGFKKSLYLQSGAVMFAVSTDRDDRLLQCLLRWDHVSLPQLLKALEISLRTRRRLGEVLVEGGHLTHEDLVAAVQNQIKDIACSAFQWTDGTWELERGMLPGSEDIILRCHPLELILEGIRRIGSWARVQEIVGGLNTEYRVTNKARDVCSKANLLPAERQIIDYCQETRTLEEICDKIPLNDFVICKFIWGLLVVNALMMA